MQASGRSSLASPSAAKQGAADEISLEVEGLDGATDLASEAQSPVRGERWEQHCSKWLWAAHLPRGSSFKPACGVAVLALMHPAVSCWRPGLILI